MEPVTLADVLRARDRRAARQAELLRRGCTVVSFTMNIPGPVKTDPDIERAFREGAALIDWQLPQLDAAVLCREETVAPTGCEALWAVDADPAALKERLCAIENDHPLGRLFDMDVIAPDGTHLSRGHERPCLICDQPARACARSRAHSVEQLFAAVKGIIDDHDRTRLCEDIRTCAVRALLHEAVTTPKPGLVDAENTGAHDDMDLATFRRSIIALGPYFLQCARIGAAGADPRALQQAGVEAEQTMLAAVGVNTHKGAIFSLGILCCAAAQAGRGASGDEILRHAAALGQVYLADMTAACPGRTGGEQQYLRYGLTGARGEAAAGFPSVREIALPAYEAALQAGKSWEDAGLHALLHLIARVQDSNIIRRAGMAGQQWASAQAQTLLDAGYIRDDLRLMNDRFVARNISPGGSADLLACTYFLHDLTTREAT